VSLEIIQILRRAEAIASAGGRGALCVIVRARGSTPQSAGSLMLVDEQAQLKGTVGGGCVEAEVRRLAHALLSDAPRFGRGDMLRFRLDRDYGWDDGLICGGTVEIAVSPLPSPEVLARTADDIEAGRPASLFFSVACADGPRAFLLHIPPRERLVIAGAGHIGQALARLATALDFTVELVDDRPDLLRLAARDGVRTHCGDIAESLRALAIDDRTHAVVVTRGHRHDEQALEALLGRGARYLGMIGSRRKVKLIVDGIAERGGDTDELARVHAPIGLDIGAITVEEIAVSIAAQLVKVRRTAEPAPLRVETIDPTAALGSGALDTDAA